MRFDDSSIPGLRSTIGYLDALHKSPQELAEFIEQKLDPDPERDRRREFYEGRRIDEARQAGQVVGRLSLTPSDDQAGGTGETISIYIDVLNRSSEMIRDVEIRIPGTGQVRQLHFIPAGETMTRRFDFLEPDYFVMNVSCGGPSVDYELRVDWEFTDAAGRRWRRHGWDDPVRIVQT